MRHNEWDLLSAYCDGELSPRDRAGIDAHLASCAAYSSELRALRLVKQAVRAAPRRSLPPALLAALEEKLSHPTWVERLSQLAWNPRIVVPVAGAAALAVGLFLWTDDPAGGEIALEPLMAAHMRYAAEGLVSQENLVHPELVSQLDVYDAE